MWRCAAAAIALAITAAAATPPSVTLAPAVLELKGTPGGGTTQTITVANNSDVPLMFDCSVVDVVTRNGKRVFVAPGELPGSIAATAILKPRRVLAPPHASASAELTVTLPQQTSIRAIVARFQGQPQSAAGGPSISMGVGSLVTFELSGKASAVAERLVVNPQTATRNLTFSDQLENTGSEPFITTGVIAILNSQQKLVTKLALPKTRFLPGERLELKAEAPGALPAGRYRAVLTVSYLGQVLSQTADFEVR